MALNGFVHLQPHTAVIDKSQLKGFELSYIFMKGNGSFARLDQIRRMLEAVL